MQRAIVTSVVDQHADELAILWSVRRLLVDSNSAALRHLERFDQRIAAHQDGCVVAHEYGIARLWERLIEPGAAQLFALAVVSLEVQDPAVFDRCLTVAETIPETIAGVVAALEWVQANRLARLGLELLRSRRSWRRRLGLAACRVHGTDPGSNLLSGSGDDDAGVRAEVLRATGELGRLELIPTCVAGLTDDDPFCRLWAALSGVLLGNRGTALDVLKTAGLAPGPYRAKSFQVALQAMNVGTAHAMLQSLAREPQHSRWLLQGSGIAGDPTYVPWLITQMSSDQTARPAGEAFSLITGTDLALLDLERKPPENFESGPNDEPDDPNVDMDPDDGLPWPDPEKIKAWWAKNGGRFQPGTRYFMGQPVTREHCIEVLKNGYQRQRILAAHYLCLLDPGTPLFNTSAPAWRQQKLLASLK
jgi:uncharacterized protein (TIGR02270 family)